MADFSILYSVETANKHCLVYLEINVSSLVSGSKSEIRPLTDCSSSANECASLPKLYNNHIKCIDIAYRPEQITSVCM